MVSELVEDLECLLERVPKSLALWQQLGRGDPQRAIADANYEAVRLGLSDIELRDRLDGLGWMVYWLMRYGQHPLASTRREGVLDALPGIDEAWSVAKQHKKVKGLLSEVSGGVRGIERKDGLILLPYNGHPELGLLDGCLRLMSGVELSDFPPNPHLESLSKYANGADAAGLWFRAPRSIQNATRRAPAISQARFRLICTQDS